MWQLPKLFAHMEEAAQYVALELTPCAGLYVLLGAGLVDALVAPAVRGRYAAALVAERGLARCLPPPIAIPAASAPVDFPEAKALARSNSRGRE